MARCRHADARDQRPGTLVAGAEAVAGTLDECLAAVRAVIAAGAEMILFTPLFDLREQMELIAADNQRPLRGPLSVCNIQA